VTKGLRKVDKSEMTHKNPELRAGSIVPSTSGASAGPKKPTKPIKPSKPPALAGKKPAKFVLEGSKWIIVSFTAVTICSLSDATMSQEYQENEPSLTVEETSLNQSINIYGCKDSTIIIKGKVNAVTLSE
jgi:adenylyl cyclase-associated protein